MVERHFVGPNTPPWSSIGRSAPRACRTGSRIGFGVEHYPFGLLTMIVSLEAIFLSTFVMISQNRADEKRNLLADNQWQIVQEEETQNKQLIELSTKILDLTKAIHTMTSRIAADPPENAGA